MGATKQRLDQISRGVMTMHDTGAPNEDDVAKYNKARWEALVHRNALFTRPKLNLDAKAARVFLDPEGALGDVSGKRVLCLAGGGGQQSAAFALLGADVTVFDLSEPQLSQDRKAAGHYNVTIAAMQGDMRDLSRLEPHSYDIVWQPYSINFVPDCRVVFREVARVIRDGGLYHFMCANPFVWGVGERDWNGTGYPLVVPYEDGTKLTYEDQDWVYEKKDGVSVSGPIEYRHTLGRLINGLIANGFSISGVNEVKSQAPDPEPGSWGHFTNIAPPWLKFWSIYRPDFDE